MRSSAAWLSLRGAGSWARPPGDAGVVPYDPHPPLPSWMDDAHVFVSGHDLEDQQDCRDVICRHNENVDMIAWNGEVLARPPHRAQPGPRAELGAARLRVGRREIVRARRAHPSAVRSRHPRSELLRRRTRSHLRHQDDHAPARELDARDTAVDSIIDGARTRPTERRGRALENIGPETVELLARESRTPASTTAPPTPTATRASRSSRRRTAALDAGRAGLRRRRGHAASRPSSSSCRRAACSRSSAPTATTPCISRTQAADLDAHLLGDAAVRHVRLPAAARRRPPRRPARVLLERPPLRDRAQAHPQRHAGRKRTALYELVRRRRLARRRPAHDQRDRRAPERRRHVVRGLRHARRESHRRRAGTAATSTATSRGQTAIFDLTDIWLGTIDFSRVP